MPLHLLSLETAIWCRSAGFANTLNRPVQKNFMEKWFTY